MPFMLYLVALKLVTRQLSALFMTDSGMLMTTTFLLTFLYQLFKNDFPDVSVHKKLINPHKLALAGDGTSVVTSARERKQCLSLCFERD
jgi:hypothetical protein